MNNCLTETNESTSSSTSTQQNTIDALARTPRRTKRCKSVSPHHTPSTGVSQATSSEPRCDYSCYTLHSIDEKKIIAIVIETKTDDNNQDAVAQVMGYVSVFHKHGGNQIPPVAFVLTQSRVDCLMFPFVTPPAKDNPERLLRAAALQFKLWEDEDDPKLNFQVYFIPVAVISSHVRELNIEVEDYRP